MPLRQKNATREVRRRGPFCVAGGKRPRTSYSQRCSTLPRSCRRTASCAASPPRTPTTSSPATDATHATRDCDCAGQGPRDATATRTGGRCTSALLPASGNTCGVRRRGSTRLRSILSDGSRSDDMHTCPAWPCSDCVRARYAPFCCADASSAATSSVRELTREQGRLAKVMRENASMRVEDE